MCPKVGVRRWGNDPGDHRLGGGGSPRTQEKGGGEGNRFAGRPPAPCTLFPHPRVRSSGVERCSYKADVGGSKPSAPTSEKAPSRSWLGAFDIQFWPQRRRSLTTRTPIEQPVHVADGRALRVPWHHPAARSSVGCPAAARRLLATTAEPPQPGRLHNPANRGVQSADHFHLIGCHGGLSVGLSAYPTGQTHPKLVMSVHRRRTTPNCQTDTYQTLLRIKSGRVCFRVHTGGPENTERERIGTQ
jgi:hypothetical protein